MSIPVLLITGSVGIGKTSVAWEISNILEDRKISHAFIDADLCYMYPRPDNDPRGQKMHAKNISALWNNLHEEGAQRLILTKVIESASDIGDIQRALPDSTITIVRLHGTIDTISERLSKREIGSDFDWHKQRAEHLLELWEEHPVGDHIVEVDNRSVHEIAEEILELYAIMLS